MLSIAEILSQELGQKLEYIDACSKVISKVPSAVERELLRERLAEETGLRGTVIENEVEKRREKLQKSQKWDIQKPKVRPNAVIKSHTADKLTSLCLQDKALYMKHKASVLATHLPPVHKKILEYLEETEDAAQIAARFPEEEAAIAAAALSMPVQYENKEAALVELIRTLEKEAYNLKVKAAIESGDLSLLNTLLMKKDSNAGGGQ